MQKIYFISGVCGAGKTSTLIHLKNKLDTNLYDVRDLDERGVPNGGGLNWLQSETRHWLEVAKENATQGKNTIICGFANPELFEEIHTENDIPAQIILLDASPETIRQRLLNRHATTESIKEIERASAVPLDTFIENNTTFAPVFKSIFEKRNLSIIQTDDKTPEEVTDEVIKLILLK